MINFKEAFEALEWLDTKCYVESPQEEKFEESVNILKQALINAQRIENELEFLSFLFKKKILPAAKKYIDEEVQMFNISFTFQKNSEAYTFLKSSLFLKELVENDRY